MKNQWNGARIADAVRGAVSGYDGITGINRNILSVIVHRSVTRKDDIVLGFIFMAVITD